MPERGRIVKILEILEGLRPDTWFRLERVVFFFDLLFLLRCFCLGLLMLVFLWWTKLGLRLLVWNRNGLCDFFCIMFFWKVLKRKKITFELFIICFMFHPFRDQKTCPKRTGNQVCYCFNRKAETLLGHMKFSCAILLDSDFSKMNFTLLNCEHLLWRELEFYSSVLVPCIPELMVDQIVLHMLDMHTTC